MMTELINCCELTALEVTEARASRWMSCERNWAVEVETEAVYLSSNRMDA